MSNVVSQLKPQYPGLTCKNMTYQRPKAYSIVCFSKIFYEFVIRNSTRCADTPDSTKEKEENYQFIWSQGLSTMCQCDPKTQMQRNRDIRALVCFGLRALMAVSWANMLAFAIRRITIPSLAFNEGGSQSFLQSDIISTGGLQRCSDCRFELFIFRICLH